MSSSRSIAAARNRRAGDNSSSSSTPSRQPPGTSINSQAAFQGARSAPMPGQRQCAVPQQPQQRFTQQPQYGQPQPPQQFAYSQQAPPSQYGQPQQPPPQPFQNVKLSVSDAIGLITLRLGKVEQTLIDQQIAEENGTSNSGVNRIPDGSVIIDKSVLNSLINRLDALEKDKKANSTPSSTSALPTVSIADFNAFKLEMKQAIDAIYTHANDYYANNDTQIEGIFKELDELAAKCNVDVVDPSGFQLDSSALLPPATSDITTTPTTGESTPATSTAAAGVVLEIKEHGAGVEVELEK